MNTKIPNSELNRLSVDEFKSSDKTPIYIVLDNIRSAQNVGSFFRTMDAFRCTELILCGITAKPPHREINKTALGASESVNWNYFESTIEAIEELKANGISTWAVEQTEKAIQLNAFTISDEKPIALVFGNEVKGVSQKVIDICDGSLEVPQFGSKHSLNISVCAGIVIWDIFAKNYLVRMAES